MGNGRREGVGLGIRLSKAEHRRLQELARACGRKPAGVIRLLIANASASDPETLAKLRSGFYTTEEVTDVPA